MDSQSDDKKIQHTASLLPLKKRSARIRVRGVTKKIYDNPCMSGKAECFSYPVMLLLKADFRPEVSKNHSDLVPGFFMFGAPKCSE
jgi:hypothetical protein